jgi:hypothetical protein
LGTELPAPPALVICFWAWLSTCWDCWRPDLTAWLAVSLLGLITVKNSAAKIAREAAIRPARASSYQ